MKKELQKNSQEHKALRFKMSQVVKQKHIEKLQHDGILKSTDDESFDQCISCLSGYPKETISYYFYFQPKNKIVVARYVKLLEKNLTSQEVNGRAGELKEIQDEDTSPSKNTSKIYAEVKAKGFTQTYGVNYEETFSPIADIRATRILIAITTFYDYEICKIDVRTAFLNGYLDEDIYMVQPKGFVDPKHPRKVEILKPNFELIAIGILDLRLIEM
uniref:Retrotransposon protein, putative, Ty1-copia subclass n=1 Tax=Tanacetum cinerariifolium TaxID=118510 RepID=A0A6L2JHL9_TANCI|nr:retrotransposon protein, putative, Ty1-copia subclass [Tanacetum cinerariifolium]